MRDKFTEWIEQGIAPSRYNTNIINNESSNYCICRLYNNIFSMITDSHMSCIKLPDGEEVHIITGGLARDKSRFEKLLYSQVWGTIDIKKSFEAAGYPQLYSLESLFNAMNWVANIEKINNDDVIVLRERPEETQEETQEYDVNIGTIYTTSESKIPQPIQLLTTDNRIESILECTQNCNNIVDLANNMNKSFRVYGDNWTPDVFNESIHRFDGRKYIMIQINNLNK